MLQASAPGRVAVEEVLNYGFANRYRFGLFSTCLQATKFVTIIRLVEKQRKLLASGQQTANSI